MSNVRKWDGEGTFAGSRGNDGVAPLADLHLDFAALAMVDPTSPPKPRPARAPLPEAPNRARAVGAGRGGKANFRAQPTFGFPAYDRRAVVG